MKGIIVYIVLVFLSVQSYAQSISGVVNIYRKVLWVDSANGRVRLSDVSGFDAYIGYKAMLIQVKGSTIDETQTSAFGNVSAINNAGNYEIGTICGFLNDTMVFVRKLNNWYDVGGLVQCVIIPKYTNVTVTDTLKAQPWDSTSGTGGVIAIEATGTLYLNKPIDAGGAGFRGGTYLNYPSTCAFTSGATDYYMQYNVTGPLQGGKKGEGIADYIVNKEYGRGKLANGGGGGNRFNAGGAGGSNYGAGGGGGLRNQGSCQSGSTAVGGAALNSYYSQGKLFFGGGGGGGHANDDFGLGGGHGGGIVFIIANTIQGNSATPGDNTIMANGAMPIRYFGLPFNIWTNASASDGSGGGGGAGAIVLQVNGFSGNTVSITANGAKGGNSEIGGNPQCCGPGGGGGGGVIWLKGASTPAGATTAVNGGANGIVEASSATCNLSNNSATGGGTGTVLFNHTFPTPKDTSPVCQQVLPIRFITGFYGRQQHGQIQLWVTVSDKEMVQQCILQRAVDGNDFTDVAVLQYNGLPDYHFTDPAIVAPKILYRAKLITRDGRVHYSAILRISNKAVGNNLAIELFPNPASSSISLQVYSAASSPATITITDATGRKLVVLQRSLSVGLNAFVLPVAELPEGVLFIQLNTAARNIVSRFVKL